MKIDNDNITFYPGTIDVEFDYKPGKVSRGHFTDGVRILSTSQEDVENEGQYVNPCSFCEKECDPSCPYAPSLW